MSSTPIIPVRRAFSCVVSNHRLGYHDLYDASSIATLHGGRVRIAALHDIIASKRHANRGKDQAALPELDRLARRQQRELDVEHDDGNDLS
jgi:hypothetical protein